MSKAAAVTAASFEAEVLRSDVPVLVDFWATWCGPCRRLAVELDALAEELDSRLRVRKIDVDQELDLVDSFGVRSVPTMIVFKGGEVVEQIVGAMPRTAILAKLEPHLGPALAARG